MGMRPLSAFIEELSRYSQAQGIEPMTVSDRELFRKAFLSNMGVVSPEAMAIASTPEAMAEITDAKHEQEGI